MSIRSSVSQEYEPPAPAKATKKRKEVDESAKAFLQLCTEQIQRQALILLNGSFTATEERRWRSAWQRRPKMLSNRRSVRLLSCYCRSIPTHRLATQRQLREKGAVSCCSLMCGIICKKNIISYDICTTVVVRCHNKKIIFVHRAFEAMKSESLNGH